MEEIIKDNRFAHIVRDPQFRRLPRKERKVKIDRRFKSMFDDSRFKLKYSVDKRGRPTNTTSTEDLKRYYELNTSSESEESSDEETIKKVEKKEKLGKDTSKKTEKSGQKKKPKNGKNLSRGFTVTPIEDKPKELVKKQKENPGFSKGNDKGVGSSDSDIEDNQDSGNEAGSSDSDFMIGDDDGSDAETAPLSEKVKKRLQDMRVDYARGEGFLLTDSSSEESTDDEEEEDDEVDHGWGELDRDAGTTEDVTHRLALCNMDWDRVHADDLMVLFHSFLPKGGVIHSISVYPSEYGLKRMKEEDEKGPQELRELKEMLEAQQRADEKKEKKERGKKKTKKRKEEESDDDDDDDDNDNDYEEEEEEKEEKEEEEEEEGKAELSGSEDGKEPDEEGEEGSHYQREKLRQYQLSRLKYYYAVLVFDSPQTANTVYEECDGREYESTSARLDLRFIPDEMSFDQEPRERCTQLPNMKKYEPIHFINTALQQSKVHLTWDETDPRRKKVTEKLMGGKVDGIDENDLKAYLASSGEEEEEGEADKEGAAAKYRALLDSIDGEEKKKNDVDMEVTWGIGLKEKIDKRLKEGAPEKLTPFQQMIQKKREKMKVKREARKMKHEQEENGGEESDEENKSGSSEDDVPSDVDMNDSYFREEFENEEFKKPGKKESKTSEKKEMKNKKHKEKGKQECDDEDSERKKAELELLLMDEDDGRQHFSLKDLLVKDKKKKKGKKRRRAEEEQNLKVQDDFQINAEDERFSALFTSHLYNIDPTDSHYKKTEAMETLRKQKLNHRNRMEEVQKKIPKLVSPEKSKLDPEISVLVKNIKRKAQLIRK